MKGFLDFPCVVMQNFVLAVESTSKRAELQRHLILDIAFDKFRKSNMLIVSILFEFIAFYDFTTSVEQDYLLIIDVFFKTEAERDFGCILRGRGWAPYLTKFPS